MLVLSHRGFHVDEPENTLPAFLAASRLGVDGIETDLRLSADGQLILFHDRLAPDGSEIGKITRAELARQMGHPIPTALEALELLPALLWNLEIKTENAVPAAIALAKQFSARVRVLFSSFVHPAVVQAVEATSLPGGLLVAHQPWSLTELPLGQSPRAKAIGTIVWKFEVIDAAVLAESRRLGWQNWLYAVDTRDDHRAAVTWPVDAIISDRPDWVLELLGRAAA